MNDMRKTVLYVAGPYRAKTARGIEKNIQAAADVQLRYIKKGFSVICPHMNTAHFDGECPDDAWLEMDIEILKRCDGIVMMKNWLNSRGAIEENRIAVERGMMVIYDDGELS